MKRESIDWVATDPTDQGRSLATAVSAAATRLGCAALLACAMSVTGCAMDSEGYIHWTQPRRNSVYAELRTVYDSRAYYWHGQLPVVHGGGFGVRPRIDTSNLTFTAPK